ncbi:MAG: hypothetical protein ACLTZB_03415 [Streptococcus salivarius]
MTTEQCLNYFKMVKTGRQNIDGKEYYFDHLGRQVKGSQSAPKGANTTNQFLKRVTNTWITFKTVDCLLR